MSWRGSPFPGLRAFTPADAPIFFGRNAETEGILARLGDPACRFLLLIGPPGSGKSSLVAAGVLPRLSANAIPGSGSWLLPSVNEVEGRAVWRPYGSHPAKRALIRSERWPRR